jgi:Leucine-rich repeat (LRR) protein
MKFHLKPANRRGTVNGSGIGGIVIDSMTFLAYLSSLFALLPFASAVLSEKEVLYHLYSNLNGDNWDTKWDTDSSDVCSSDSYPGVTCNTAGKITEINLKDNNLAGSVSPHVYTLSHLKHLDLSKNRITSAGFDRIDVVIEEEDDIGDVEVIELTNNLVSSVKGVSKLAKSLTGLHMSFNNLKGTMPSELFSLPLLEILAVSENEISGTIDKRLGNLTNLLEFYCYGNKLTGTIPSEIGHLTKMQIITVSRSIATHASFF